MPCEGTLQQQVPCCNWGVPGNRSYRLCPQSRISPFLFEDLAIPTRTLRNCRIAFRAQYWITEAVMLSWAGLEAGQATES